MTAKPLGIEPAHDVVEGGDGMPKVSKDSAPQRQEAGPVVDLRDELNGYRLAPTSERGR